MMTLTPLDPNLYRQYQSFKQEHVFQFYDELSEDQRQQLLFDARHIDLQAVTNNFNTVKQSHSHTDAHSEPLPLSPFTAVTDISALPVSQRTLFYENGLRAIANGTVAAVLMAGGQGTRLGSAAPKGCFDIGLPSHKSLFQVQAERLQRLVTLASQFTSKPANGIVLRWFVMTSIATHTATIQYFTDNSFFGLSPKTVHFFLQHELPAMSDDGKILLETKSKISLAPNGNGGIFHALEVSGSLKVMRDSGVQHIHVYGVDNALVKIADPTLIGFALHSSSHCVNKVVLKTDPSEKVGVMALRGGEPHVVEYSEIPPSLAAARDDSGRLLYSAGNIAQHYFHIDFLHSVTQQALPFHVANKAVHFVDTTGTLVKPVKPNAVKLEMFIFDIFSRDPNMTAMAVRREEEFSGVKNASGIDSPETARQALTSLHRSWVEAAGGSLVGEGAVEVSPLLSYGGEGLEARVKGYEFALPIEIK